MGFAGRENSHVPAPDKGCRPKSAYDNSCTLSVEGIPAEADVSTGRVAITAVDAVVADVVFVTKLDRLLTFEPLVRCSRTIG